MTLRLPLSQQNPLLAHQHLALNVAANIQRLCLYAARRSAKNNRHTLPHVNTAIGYIGNLLWPSMRHIFADRLKSTTYRR